MCKTTNYKMSSVIKISIAGVLLCLILACKEAVQKKEHSLKTSPNSSDTSQIKEQEKNRLIVPGKQMGSFVLEENSGPIVDSLPESDYSDAAMGKVLLKWNDVLGDSLQMFNTQKMGVEDYKRIKTIRSFSTQFRTKNDLGVNSSFNQIQKQFNLNKKGTIKEDQETFILYTNSQGIGFEMDEEQNCRAVLVFSEDAFLTPFYPNFIEHK